MRYSKFLAALFVIMLLAVSANAHELTIKAAKYHDIKSGEKFDAEIQSSHKFIIPEEVEILSRVKAGLIQDGKLIESELKANNEALCIDFSVTAPEGTFILAAIKDGESWCVTNEGGKSGSRSELEAQGLKVLSANKYDKYAKAIFNASHDDNNYSHVLNHPLEIIPVTNPADVKQGEYFHVRIMLNGQPYTGPVWASYDGFVTEYENTYAYYTESENGEAYIKITHSGWWGVRASQTGLPGKSGDYDNLNLRAFLLFEVK